MNRITAISLVIVVFLFASLGSYYFILQKKAPTTSQISPQQSSQQSSKPQDYAKIAEEQKSKLKDTMIPLQEQNNSKESGVAVLSEVNGKAQVSITMTNGYPKDTPQPAHIHSGKCPQVGEVVYPLTDLVNGRSVTQLSISLSQLQKQTNLAINVHKSQSESNIYIACGNLGENPFD